ncbi:heme A synthase [Weizmannia acidilactici]|uniref:Heme A synthase n=1 Tax=Weizmannia acidilactici TaxID=2607726 RepID=A0A5J4JKE0_9BACI|nr:heme A synthase [Weizmannia acidilactici]GER68421.1 heme A synthase [Weizmannia acidilactici]GER70817.1 heme A synthase [Weizmannia acidilactici]GER74924.1 heme A synthase [Weizmannia acidilactici]
MRTTLKWLGVLTTISMMIVLIGGALVTNTGSSLGCGRQWPLCNGKIFPDPLTLQSLIEWLHRFCTGIASFLVFVLAFWSWFAIGHKKETKFLAIVSIVFLLLQAYLGAAAVVWGSSSVVMALHFGISLISFASVLMLTLLIFEWDQKFDAGKLILEKSMKWHTIGVTVYSYIVVYSGALVRHMNASLVCRDFPLCVNDSPALPANIYEWVQMGHRTAAFLFFVWIAYIAYKAVKNYKNQRVIYWGWIIAFILVCLQAASGAMLIFTRLNLEVTLLHAFFISCLFGLLCYLNLVVGRAKQFVHGRNNLPQAKIQVQ